MDTTNMTPLQNKREMFEKALAQKDFETAQAIISDTEVELMDTAPFNDFDYRKKYFMAWEDELNAAADKELHV